MISKKTINAIEVCVFLAGQRHAGYVTTTELSPPSVTRTFVPGM